jgi:hypothetical protein
MSYEWVRENISKRTDRINARKRVKYRRVFMETKIISFQIKVTDSSHTSVVPGN